MVSSLPPTPVTRKLIRYGDIQIHSTYIIISSSQKFRNANATRTTRASCFVFRTNFDYYGTGLARSNVQRRRFDITLPDRPRRTFLRDEARPSQNPMDFLGGLDHAITELS